MRVPFEWLKEFVDVRGAPLTLAERLTMGGLEVEKIEGEGDGVVFELGVTPNRSDCLSIRGVAREVSAVTGCNMRPAVLKPPVGSGKIKDSIKIEIRDAKRCPRYTARIIRDVRIGPSPAWMAKRLAASGVRPINNIVDATNYVMLETGQPLHAFDLNLIRGSRVIVKKASEAKSFTTLDGIERRLNADDLLISDGEGAVALAGVMGGANSQVCGSTEGLLLESAFFEPAGVRRTGKRLGLVSESLRRFERGVDPNGALAALHRLTEIILQVAGGTPTVDWADVYPKKVLPKTISLPLAEAKRILGIDVETKHASKIFKALEFTVTGQGKAIRVRVPTFRPDICRPIDLIEELARVMGYEKIPETMPTFKMRRVLRPRFDSEALRTRCSLVDAGFSEAVLYGFTSKGNIAHFGPPQDTTLSITNPISEDEAQMRTFLVPGLLDAARLNFNRQLKSLKLFAFQNVYEEANGKPLEVRHLAGLMCGRRNTAFWERSLDEVDFYDIKGALQVVTESLRLQASYTKTARSFLHPGASADVILLNDKVVGFAGQIHPDVASGWDLDSGVFVFEVDFDAMAEFSVSEVRKFSEPSRFPFVERDLAILIDAGTLAEEVEDTVNAAKSQIVCGVRIFDVYTGKGVPAGKKSIALTIRYASPERTLSDEEVCEAQDGILAQLKLKLGAGLRT